MFPKEIFRVKITSLPIINYKKSFKARLCACIDALVIPKKKYLKKKKKLVRKKTMKSNLEISCSFNKI